MINLESNLPGDGVAYSFDSEIGHSESFLEGLNLTRSHLEIQVGENGL
jgi:hypothetical protein